MDKGSNVRFTTDSRNGDWRKGDLGTITRVLALPPANQYQLFVVSIEEAEVWATDRDIELHEQLSLF